MKLACCGQDCSGCEAFIATQTNDHNLRIKVAKEWSELFKSPIEASDIVCDGCREEGRKFYYCENMCTVRKCVNKQGFENCAPCAMYPCREIETIFKFIPELRAKLDALRP